MQIAVDCEQCHRAIRTREALADNTIKCPRCGHLQYVPGVMGGGVPALVGTWKTPVSTKGRAYCAATWDTGARPCVTVVPELPAETAPAADREVLAGTPDAVPLPVVVAISEVESEAPGRGLGEYLYWVLALTLIPLGLAALHPQSDVKERFERTQQSHPDTFRRWAESEEPTLDSLLTSLPDQRLEGAYLPRETWWHWAYAGTSAGGFLLVILLVFPRRAVRAGNLIAVGLFTGTAGIFMLLAVQLLAEITQGLWLHGAGIVTLIFYILKFIGFSYRSALDPNSNFLLSFIGFTFGVGLCEELCKALPLVWYYRTGDSLSWRGICRWGLASGAAFGVAEGITYSSEFYNGVHGASTYVVRFVSCVALHAMWAASVGITLHRNRRLFQGQFLWYDYLLPVLRILAVAMVLHGLYDTVLKMELHEMALATAVVSFGWLAWQIEGCREAERSTLAST